MGLSLGALFLARRELMGRADDDRVRIWHNLVGMVFGFFNSASRCASVLSGLVREGSVRGGQID